MFVDDGILSLYEKFRFSILPYSLNVAQESIVRQAHLWGKELNVNSSSEFDIRKIYNSSDGPSKIPAAHIGIILREVSCLSGDCTLFVSNVADGYSSMVYMLSKLNIGDHFSIELSLFSAVYPKNSLSIFENGVSKRVVYSMRDSNSWVFFERGEALNFENSQFYHRYRKRDRLTPEIISTYMSLLGFGSLRKDFWISTEPAHVLWEDGFQLWDDFK